MLLPPFAILAIGIVTVIGMILVFRINAFIALITAAIVVSLLGPPAAGNTDRIKRVAEAFGSTAGGIGIVIALAAVIGKCLMDSGAADRIVRAFLSLLGEKRASFALMGSGFVLAVPVFFDTVFYLLVPLARSLHRKTGKNYLMYLLAIAAGGAITHTLVPPTPGPLLMADNLGIDLGKMIFVGSIVALPAALAGIAVSVLIDRKMPVPMRQVGGVPEPDPIPDDQLPPLWISLLPVLLPVILIGADTFTGTFAKSADKTKTTTVTVTVADDEHAPDAANDAVTTSKNTAVTTGNVLANGRNSEGETPSVDLFTQPANGTVDYNNDGTFTYTPNADFSGRDAFTYTVDATFWQMIKPYTSVIGNPNFALLVSTAIAIVLLQVQRSLALKELAEAVESSLMSGGAIILITAGGGAFGGMLKIIGLKEAIQAMFEGGQATGMMFLFIGFGMAALLKVAQGSSTVAMITGSSMLAAMGGSSPGTLGFDPVYLATAIGAGSLIGSWMNDSGFWIFTKMGGLTEAEGLKSWTPLLIVLGLVSMAMSMLLANVVPLV